MLLIIINIIQITYIEYIDILSLFDNTSILIFKLN